MPPLTWRDTVQPDFSNTLSGIRQTGDALSRGFGGIGDALGKFNDYAQGQNAAALMANAVKYTNPADLQAALADGSILKGVNPGYLTADALKSTQGQVATLLSNAANTETNKFNLAADPHRLHTLEDNSKMLDGTLAARIASPTLANEATKAQTGLTVANTGVANANAGSILSNTLTTNQNRDQSNVLFGRGTDAYKAQQEAIPLINQLGTQTISPDDVQNLLSSDAYKQLSPQAQQQVLAHVTSVNAGGGGASVGSGSRAAGAISAAAAGAPGSTPANPFSPIAETAGSNGAAAALAASSGSGAIPAAQRTALIQQAVAGTPIPPAVIHAMVTQESQWDPTKMGKAGDRGLMQILDSTAKDPGYSLSGVANPNDLNDPASNLRFGAQYLYQKAKANGMKDSDWNDPAKVSQALKLYNGGGDPDYDKHVMRYMDGIDPASNVSDANKELYALEKERTATNSRAASVTQAIGSALSQQTANNINAKYTETQKDERDPGTIANEMVRVGSDKSPAGPFAGVPVGRLINEIGKLRQMSPGMTAATAAAIIASNPKGADMWDRTVPGFLGGHVGPIPNDASDEALAKEFNAGHTDTGAQQAQIMQATQAVIGQRQVAHQAALTDLATALHNKSVTPAQLEGYRQKAAITRVELNQALAGAEKDPTMKFKPNTQVPGNEAAPAAASPVTAAISAAVARLKPNTSLPLAPQDTGYAATPVAAAPVTIRAGKPAASTSQSIVQAALDRAAQARDQNDPKPLVYRRGKLVQSQ